MSNDLPRPLSEHRAPPTGVKTAQTYRFAGYLIRVNDYYGADRWLWVLDDVSDPDRPTQIAAGYSATEGEAWERANSALATEERIRARP